MDGAHHLAHLCLSKPEMKLLVLAQTPPPLHGQSFMVQTLLDGLPPHGFELRHVPFSLSRDAADIGRARLGKLFAAGRVVARARAELRREAFDAVYYVPAPGKRAAMWRDVLVLGRLRRECPKLVLHFHAAGLGAWLERFALRWENALARRALAHPDLALVLTPSLATDARALQANSIAIVPNGIPDPGALARREPSEPRRLLFLGALSREKGVGVLLQAAHQLAGSDPVEVVLAGEFADIAEKAALEPLAAAGPAKVTWAGFVQGPAKAALLRSATALCLPTFYPHEAQPLVLLEALAHDLPIVATRWRGIAETLPPGSPLAEPRSVESLLATLRAVLACPPPPGLHREHFLTHYTRERHLAALATALRLPSTRTATA
jgi:glycosyltransferase involved in cell wall biosynthesis